MLIIKKFTSAFPFNRMTFRQTGRRGKDERQTKWRVSITMAEAIKNKDDNNGGDNRDDGRVYLVPLASGPVISLAGSIVLLVLSMNKQNFTDRTSPPAVQYLHSCFFPSRRRSKFPNFPIHGKYVFTLYNTHRKYIILDMFTLPKTSIFRLLRHFV